MKFILEIQAGAALPPTGFDQAYAVLVDERASVEGAINQAPWPTHRFLRIGDAQDFTNVQLGSFTGFAVDVRNGQFDLDRISTALRVAELHAARPEHSVKLILYPYPDLASLADENYPILGSPRVHAIAHDEERVMPHHSGGMKQLPAPLVYARARLVATARKLGVAAFLRPQWSADESENDEIMRAAKADGFDGLIGAAEHASFIYNM